MLSRELIDKALDLNETILMLEGWQTVLVIDPTKAADPVLAQLVDRISLLVTELQRDIADARTQMDARLGAGLLGKSPDEWLVMKWQDVREQMALWLVRQRVELASKALASLQIQLARLEGSELAGPGLQAAVVGVVLFGQIAAQQVLGSEEP